MRRLITRKSLLAAVLFLGACGFSASQVAACDAPRCYWKTVTVYIEREQPYVKHVVQYDHCDKPYIAEVVAYRTVRVPVQKRVKVCY